MSSPETPLDISKNDARFLLDLSVDTRCLKFYRLWRTAPPLPVSLGGVPLTEQADEYDDALMELIFYSDARAQLDNDDYNFVNELSWTGAAREGFLRLSKFVPAMEDIHHMNSFVVSAGNMAMMLADYDDMCLRRRDAEDQPVTTDRGPAYAAQVAVGSIVLR